MHARLFRLKPSSLDPYPPGQCSAARCVLPSAVTYSAPQGPWPGQDVPLCDRHHGELCDWQDSRLAGVDRSTALLRWVS